jgi:hypothetical protein
VRDEEKMISNPDCSRNGSKNAREIETMEFENRHGGGIALRFTGLRDPYSPHLAPSRTSRRMRSSQQGPRWVFASLEELGYLQPVEEFDGAWGKMALCPTIFSHLIQSSLSTGETEQPIPDSAQEDLTRC